MKAINPIFLAKLSQDEIQKVIEVANFLDIEPNWLFSTMYFETAKTLSPAKTNSIGSVGLIQFTRDKAGVDYKTINGKRYKLKDIAKMSFIKQMDLVRDYYTEVKKITGASINSLIDTYFATFFPYAIGKPDSYVLETKGLTAALIAKQNPIFDQNKDKQVKKIEVENYLENWFGSNIFSSMNQKKNTNFLTSYFNSMKQFFIKFKKPLMIVGGVLLLIVLIRFLYKKYAK